MIMPGDVMGIPLRQQIRVGAYVLKQRLLGARRYPLVLMLEPLFRCNLACAGCGKIDYPTPILNQRLSRPGVPRRGRRVRRAGGRRSPAASRCCTRRSPQIVAGLIARRKFVYLCTNALLLEKKIDLFKPSPFFTFSVHLDGLRDDHDRSVCQEGVFDRAVAAIRLRAGAGFRVNVNATLFDGADARRVAAFFDYVTDDSTSTGITVSPGYAYERAPDQEHFLNRRKTKELFRDDLPPRPGRSAPGSSASPRCSSISSPATSTIAARRGATRPATSSAGSGPAICSRGLRQDLQGADGGDRLGQLRHRQLREMRQLHGALRLRGDRGRRTRSSIR